VALKEIMFVKVTEKSISLFCYCTARRKTTEKK